MARKHLLIATAVSLLIGSGSLAQQAQAASVAEFEGVKETPKSELLWTAGLGLAAVPDYEGSKDYKMAPVPYVTVFDKNGMSAELVGNVLRANVIPSNTWRFGPMVRYRAERRDVNNDKVDKMEIIDSAIEMGAYAGLDINNWSFKVDMTADTSGVYNGPVADASISYTWVVSPWRFTLGGSTTFAGENYMNTYFGVNAQDSAASGLRTYHADRGFKDVGGSFLAGYRIDNHWGVTGALRYTQLLGDAADSPVVKDEGSPSQVVCGVLATYTF
jgi:outer membrane scaffolding protein for murein synthesis (MipA/OmpV family)